MSVDYKAMLEEVKEEKWNELSKNNHFLALPRLEQSWWTHYWKILQSYEHYILKDCNNEEEWEYTVYRYLTSDQKINEVMAALAKEYNPWSRVYDLNYWLKEAIHVLEGCGVDWKHYPYKNMMIFCNCDPVHGHKDCAYIQQCQLKKNRIIGE